MDFVPDMFGWALDELGDANLPHHYHPDYLYLDPDKRGQTKTTVQELWDKNSVRRLRISNPRVPSCSMYLLPAPKHRLL